jgi:hypothetical protein
MTSTNPGAINATLGAIATTALTVTKTLNVVTDSIGMLDALVSKTAREQSLTYRKDERNFIHNLVRQAAVEKAEADMTVVDFRKQSTKHAELFDVAFTEFEALFANELNPST